VRTSAIILSYRPGDWLASAIDSVVDQVDDLVVVDNGSEDATASGVAGPLGARVVRSARNLGFAGGVNLGWRHAQGDVVALLNDDAVASPGWMAGAVASLAASDVAAVVPKVLLTGWYKEVRFDDPVQLAAGDPRPLGRRLSSATVDGRDVLARLRGPGVYRLEQQPHGDRWRWTCPGRPLYVPVPDPDAPVRIDGEPVGGRACRLLNKAGSMLHEDGTFGDIADGEPDDGQWDRPGERFFASGTAVVLRADAFAQVGTLAEPLFAYYEDVDWSWRARLAGWRVRYDPATVVEHRHGATSGGAASRWVQRVSPRNHLLCVVRNAPAAVIPAIVARHLAEPDPAGMRRSFACMVPWAVASRRRLARRWVLSPGEIWAAWAGAVEHPVDAAHRRRAATTTTCILAGRALLDRQRSPG